MATTKTRSSSSSSKSSGSRSRRSTASSGGNKSSAQSAQSANRAATEGTEAVAERIRELNERIIDSSKKAGKTYLDIYERTLNSIADYQEKVGEQSQVDWVSTIANAQANFTRDLANAYSSAARSLLK